MVRQISLETAVSEIVKDTAVQLSCNCVTGFPGRRCPLEYSSCNLILSAKLHQSVELLESVPG